MKTRNFFRNTDKKQIFFMVIVLFGTALTGLAGCTYVGSKPTGYDFIPDVALAEPVNLSVTVIDNRTSVSARGLSSDYAGMWKMDLVGGLEQPTMDRSPATEYAQEILIRGVAASQPLSTKNQQVKEKFIQITFNYFEWSLLVKSGGNIRWDADVKVTSASGQILTDTKVRGEARRESAQMTTSPFIHTGNATNYFFSIGLEKILADPKVIAAINM
jgi:hypothetical protein